MSREREKSGAVVRVSASTERGARQLADEMGRADVASTPNGWVVSVPTGGERVPTLARLAEAARAVVEREPLAELFVLDGQRPVRIPPRHDT